jgi:hypothetical protein
VCVFSLGGMLLVPTLGALHYPQMVNRLDVSRL